MIDRAKQEMDSALERLRHVSTQEELAEVRAQVDAAANTASYHVLGVEVR